MIMRGLPVPRAKRLYIVRNTKREAEALGLPFGPIADPVGGPTARWGQDRFWQLERDLIAATNASPAQ